MDFLTYLLFSCLLSSLLIHAPAADTAAAGTIERTTKQQILASITPDAAEKSVLFLTSPSGKYAASLLRRGTAPGAGGLGNDFCYVQVEDTSTGRSMWESECAPVSTANACSVVFDQNGMTVFDGNNPVWDTGAQSSDSNYLQTLELVDLGDMRIRDKGGELAWKASDDVRANQNCGMPGSPGMAPAMPPFATPIGGNTNNHPFGQRGAGGALPQQPALPQSDSGAYDQQPQHALGGGASRAFGFNNQPLVDNSPYDSGCFGGAAGRWVAIGAGLFFAVLV